MSSEPAKPPHSGVFVPPPLIYVAVFVAGYFMNRMRPLPVPAQAVVRTIAGVILIATGLCIAGWSIASFRRAGTSLVPIKASTALVVSGPFRFSRNPMYFSLALAYLGASLLLDTLWPVVLFPVLIALVHFLVIVREERYMSAIFGSAYADYRTRVRRWI